MSDDMPKTALQEFAKARDEFVRVVLEEMRPLVDPLLDLLERLARWLRL